MPRKRPFVASLNQVHITRDGEIAIIEYADPDVWTTHFKLGPEVQALTDEEILDRWNRGVEATEDFMAEQAHVCVEIPAGRPQLRWAEGAQQWTPRGDVVRAVVMSGDKDAPAIEVDGKEMSWAEFGTAMSTYEGWGFRLCFVPEDEIHEPPAIVVRDPGEADA